MEASELSYIIAKFDPLSDYSEDDMDIFKQPIASRARTRLRPCLKMATIKSDSTGTAEQRPKIVRFPAAHLLSICLMTGKRVPTREEEHATAGASHQVDVESAERPRWRRQPQRKRRRARPLSDGILHNDLSFHHGGVHYDAKTMPKKLDMQSQEFRYLVSRGFVTPCKNKAALKAPQGSSIVSKHGSVISAKAVDTRVATDPEELALDRALLQASQNATINAGDAVPLRTVDRFAWQIKWEEEDRCKREGC